MSTKKENTSKESKEPDYDEDKEQLEEKQEEETGEIDKGNNESSFLNLSTDYLQHIKIFNSLS